jgi:hypothetical protein
VKQFANISQGKEATGVAAFFNKYLKMETKVIQVTKEEDLRNLDVFEEMLDRLALWSCTFTIKQF